MKWLVYGAKGWIGQMFVAELSRKTENEIVSTSTRVDCTEEVRRELELYKPDRVVSLIGRTSGPGIGTIDYLEQPGKLQENVRDNLFGPLSLALLCKERGIHFTYLGTGCIFSYDAEHLEGSGVGFAESSEPNFFGSSYSTVKGFTDRLMHLMPDALNLRIRMPISAEDNSRDFITKIKGYSKVVNIQNSMTVLPSLLPCAIKMAEDKVTGTVNLTNPGTVSHNEVLEMHKKSVDPNYSWENFTIEEQDAILASKRSNNELDTARLRELCPDVLGIKEAIGKFRFGSTH